MQDIHQTNEPVWEVVSYLTLRRLVGFLGFALPILVAAGCAAMGEWEGLERSISAYYHTVMRDLFVGILVTIGCFLFAYRGYSRLDDRVGDIAGLCAAIAAFFPCNDVLAGGSGAWIGAIHLIAATGLFLLLAFFSLRLFTKTREGVPPTPEKLIRNKIYVACGVIILVCIALISLYMIFLKETTLARYQPVFWLETFALWAFGTSWFVKGRTLLQDAKS